MKIPQYDIDGLGAEFKVTEQLEEDIANFLGVRHCVMVSSGTAAIFLALRAAGVKKVAIPKLTMVATAMAAELAGCDIVLVSNNDIPKDVDAFVHVSLNGRDCGIKTVIEENPDLLIIEDSCQSFGSKFDGKYLGTYGKIGCFSFSPHKILSAGNGGCVVTDDPELAREIRRLKNFGREFGGSDIHKYVGYNFKFTDLQASFMLPQFKDIKERVERKKGIYNKYLYELGDLMLEHKGTPWFVDVYVDERDKVISSLEEAGVGTRKMYPLVSEQVPFKECNSVGDAQEDMRRSHMGLWLPSSLKLSDEDIDYVIKNVRGVVSKKS